MKGKFVDLLIGIAAVAAAALLGLVTKRPPLIINAAAWPLGCAAVSEFLYVFH
jgi:hypothetical protein